MARYIDADKLKADFCESCSTHKRYHLTVEQCRAIEKERPHRKWCFKMRLIDNAPTADVVQVVRCRECRHCEIIIDQFENDWYFCKEAVNNAEVKSDDFCSYGERKEK